MFEGDRNVSSFYNYAVELTLIAPVETARAELANWAPGTSVMDFGAILAGRGGRSDALGFMRRLATAKPISNTPALGDDLSISFGLFPMLGNQHRREVPKLIAIWVFAAVKYVVVAYPETQKVGFAHGFRMLVWDAAKGQQRHGGEGSVGDVLALSHRPR